MKTISNLEPAIKKKYPEIDTVRLIEAKAFLETVPSELIDIELFRADPQQIDNFECNTVACAIGHLTAMLTEEERKRVINHELNINFYLVSKILFNIHPIHTLWSFMFSSDWAYNEATNTKDQLLKRIQYVIDHNTVPSDFVLDGFDFELIL